MAKRASATKVQVVEAPPGSPAAAKVPATEQKVTEQEFRELHEIPTAHMAGVLFRAIDTDKSGTITEKEYVDFVESLTNDQSSPARVVGLFTQLLDINGDGELSEEELRDMINLHDSTGSVTGSLLTAVLGDGDSITCTELGARLLQKENHTCVESLRAALKSAFAPKAAPRARRKRAAAASGSMLDVSGETVAVVIWWTIVLTTAIARGVLFARDTRIPSGTDANGTATDNPPSFGYSAAKATALPILFAFPAIYFTRLPLVAHSFWPWLRLLATSTVVHAHIGASIFLCSVVHVLAHLAKDENSAGPLFAKAQLQHTLSGLALIVIMALLSIPAFRRLSKTSAYRPFLMLHMLHYLTVPLLILHMPPKFPGLGSQEANYVLLGTLLALIALYEFVKHHQTITGSVDEHCRRVGSHVTALTVPNGASSSKMLAHTVPGTYYKVRVPAVSWWESHPFSLATSTFGITKDFLISDLGVWTKKFGQLVANTVDHEGGSRARVQISGPYCAPCMTATTENRALLVATGIGITPSLSIVHHTIFENAAMEINKNVATTAFGARGGAPQKGQEEAGGGAPVKRSSLLGMSDLQKIANSLSAGAAAVSPTTDAGDDSEAQRAKKKKAVLLIWSVRDAHLVSFFIRYLATLLTAHSGTAQGSAPNTDLRVHLYFTGATGKTVASFAYTTFLQMYLSQLAALSNGAISVFFKRPDIKGNIREFDPTGVYYCGGAGFGKAVSAACKDASTPCHQEIFQDTTLAKLIPW